MADKTTTIRVVIDSSNAARALEVLRGNFKATAEVVKETGQVVDKTMKDVEKSIKNVDSSLGFLTKAFKAAFVLDAVTSFGHQLYEVNSKFQGFVATMTVVTGSVADSKREFEYLVGIANKYGVSIQSLTSTYSKLAAAGKDSAMTHQDLHKIFEAMALSSNVLHLSVEETRLVFYALQQMVSKGNVTMEELRRQLAEKFPGAVNMMGQALEVPVKELERLIKTGQVAADQALPKFAEIIMKSFGPASQYAINSLNAVVTRMHNAWFMFMQTLAESSSLVPKLIEAINWFSNALNTNKGAAIALGDELGNIVAIVVDWLKKLTAEDIRTFFKTVTDIISTLVPILEAGALALKGWALILGPVIKDMAELMKLLADGRWKDGFLAFANLGKNFVPGPLRTALEELEKGMKGWHAATQQGAESGRKHVGVIKQLEESTIKYGKSTTDQIKDLEVEYALSMRSIEVKTKSRDALSELVAMERLRENLRKTATDPSKSDADRIAAYRQLISNEKDYVAVLKEANQERKQAEAEHKKALEPALKYIEALDKEADAILLTTEELQAKQREQALSKLSGQEYVEMLNKIIAAQNRLNGAKAKEKWEKEAEERVKSSQMELDQINKAIIAQEKHNATIGLGKNGLREYEIAMLEAAAATLEMNLASSENYDVSEKEYELWGKKLERLRLLINLKRTGDSLDDKLEETIKAQQASAKLWKDLDDYTDKFFQDLIINGKSAFDSLIADLKRFAAELLSLVARKFIFSIAGSFIGGPEGGAMMNTAVNAGANTVAGSVLNWGANAMGITGGIGAFGTGLAAGWAGSASVPMAAYAVPELATTAGAFGEALGTALASIPGWGWALMAVIAIGAWLSGRGGGPKQEGQGYAEFDADGQLVSGAVPSGSRWVTNSMMDTVLNSAVEATGVAFQRSLQRYGGTTDGAIGFQYAAALDTQGDAPNIIRSGVTIGGRSVYDRTINEGRPEDFEGQTKLEMARMVLAGLQNSQLPHDLANVFNTLSAATATEEQISNLFKLADAIMALYKMTEPFTETDLEQVALASATAWEQYKAQGEALQELAESFDGSAESMAALTAATEAYRKSQVQLLIDIQNIAKELDKMFASSRKIYETGGMSNEEKYKYLQADTERLVTMLESATDPAEIQRLSGMIDSNMREAFGLLTPEQQALQRQQFLASLDYLDTIVKERLAIARQSILDDNAEDPDSPLATVADKLDKFVDGMKPIGNTIDEAGDKMLTAANTQVKAANTPQRVDIYINDQYIGPGVVNGG